MAQDKKVEQITSMEDDFAQWYTDICKKAELIDYSSVKGFMILRPYGYAIWENIQRIMDGEFKKTGHENVAMPALIPESLLKKEGELVNGFAPEVAWVTMGGSDKLEERLAFRPTSETMFCDHWHSVLQTYRQLPMLCKCMGSRFLRRLFVCRCNFHLTANHLKCRLCTRWICNRHTVCVAFPAGKFHSILRIISLYRYRIALLIIGTVQRTIRLFPVSKTIMMIRIISVLQACRSAFYFQFISDLRNLN